MKLAICVPVRDTVHSAFAYCLNELTSHLVRSNVDYNLFFQNGSVLPEQRTALVSSALNAKCDYILWLDSDMVFPKNLYQRLSSHNYDIVACTYSTRTKPYRNVAFLTHDFNDRLTASVGVHNVSSVGMGLMLTNIDVYRSITKPWFMFDYDVQTSSYLGEDIYFCRRLVDSGYNLYVDVDTSKKCYHLGTVELGTI
jgi:choline kinase